MLTKNLLKTFQIFLFSDKITYLMTLYFNIKLYETLSNKNATKQCLQNKIYFMRCW